MNSPLFLRGDTAFSPVFRRLLGVALLQLALGVPGLAQDLFQTLWSFGVADQAAAAPRATIIQGSDGRLYGTTDKRGQYGLGTVYRVAKDGTGFQVLHHFGGNPADGAEPQAPVLEGPDGKLYGTTSKGGGAPGGGTVYRLNKDGTGYGTILFLGVGPTDGYAPWGGLTWGGDGYLYGSTIYDRGTNVGTLFRVQPDGSAFQHLHRFTGANGSTPMTAARLASDGMLYGVTPYGGASGRGVLYRLQRDGSSFQVLRDFAGTDGRSPQHAPLEGTDGWLYGTTREGGPTSNSGLVYKVAKNGTGYVILHRFNSSDQATGVWPASGLLEGPDGLLYGEAQGGKREAGLGVHALYRISKDGSAFEVLPQPPLPVASAMGGGLLLVEGRLAGVAYAGAAGQGSIFLVNIDGSGWEAVWRFTMTGGDPNYPYGGLVEDPDGFLLGSSYYGGAGGGGCVFRLRKDGSGRSVVVPFQYSEGTVPGYYAPGGSTPLTAPTVGGDGRLYGSASRGGKENLGLIYRANRDGSEFTILHDCSRTSQSWDIMNPSTHLVEISPGLFCAADTGYGDDFLIRSDGSGLTGFPAQVRQPGDFTLGRDGLLYYVETSGGSNYVGHVQALNPLSGEAQTLHVFATDPRGYYPAGRVLLASDGRLYGTARSGGAHGHGVVYGVGRDGSGFTVLHDFQGVDGTQVQAGVVEGWDGLLYGVAQGGGTTTNGVLYRLQKNGQGFTVVHKFDGPDGRFPVGELLVGSDGALFGVTQAGGAMEFGTVFRHGPPPVQARFIPPAPGDPQGGALVVAWPEGATEWQLHGAPSLDAPVAAWQAVTNTVVVTNGLRVVRLPAAGSLEFFRLVKP